MDSQQPAEAPLKALIEALDETCFHLDAALAKTSAQHSEIVDENIDLCQRSAQVIRRAERLLDRAKTMLESLNNQEGPPGAKGDGAISE